MATIRLIHNPSFDVNYQQFIEDKKTVELSGLQKVQTVMTRPIELIGYIFIAVGRSAGLVLSFSWVSFKLHVLGYYGSLSKYRPPSDLYLVMFKVILWALGVFWCFTTTTLRLLIEQMSPPSKEFLGTYTSGSIDTAHLRTQEQAIDVSHVPADVSVDVLMTLFEGINFTQETKPGYMAPSSRQEGKTTIHSVDELKKGLTEFIQNVKCRTPFLGTPPAYDTPRLMAFYQQIEDALRFSIHKVNQDLAAFQNNEEKKQEYNNLLENKARLAIDMAIAGKHCGARYMGEAMSTYMSLRGDGAEGENLQDCLIELLATKRSEIAQGEAYKIMGNSTHGFSQYMASLGEPLGLPGTRNVIEHMSGNINMDACLRSFFDAYTVDVIIDTVQEKIKKSQNFREKITDWLKDQVGNWKKENRDVDGLLKEIQPIVDAKAEQTESHEACLFAELIAHLTEKKIEWPKEEGWDNFVIEVFILNESKEWLKEKFPNFKIVQGVKDNKKIDVKIFEDAQREKNQMIQKLKEHALGTKAATNLRIAILEGKPLSLGGVNANDSEQKKIDAIRQILPINSETLSRVIKGEVTLVEIVRNYLDLERRNQFITALKLENIADVGVSPALLEWLLVSQEILLPQAVN